MFLNNSLTDIENSNDTKNTKIKKSITVLTEYILQRNKLNDIPFSYNVYEYDKSEFHNFYIKYNNYPNDIYTFWCNSFGKPAIKILIKNFSQKHIIIIYNSCTPDAKKLILTMNECYTIHNKNILQLENSDSDINLCYVELFDITELQINIFKNETVSKILLVSNEELIELKKFYFLKTLTKLPLILSRDPVIKFLNIPIHSVIKIEREGEVFKDNYLYYRYVIA